VTSAFSFIKLIYIVLSAIPKSEIAELKGYDDSELLLLISNILNSITIALNYINDIFFSS